jgi:6-pyruvoyltetrahydropterin/6-carboxytetrahydropterin synthase
MKPTTIRITKEFRFEMAHALLGYDGPCKNIHGHSYQLSVTIKGIPITNPVVSQTGMVADFTDIKRIVNDKIIQHFDHALVLNKTTPASIYAGLQDQKLILLDFQPTCENLVVYFVNKLKDALPPALTLHSLQLKETSTSSAAWYAEDNE